MGKVIAARLIRLIATLLAVTFLTFSMTALLPGDPVNAILGVDSVRDPEVVAKIRADLGLDDPFFIRYVNWLGNTVTGDLGQSYITDQEVSSTISQRLPVTAQLAFMAIIMALVLAIPIGVLGAYKQGEVAGFNNIGRRSGRSLSSKLHCRYFSHLAVLRSVGLASGFELESHK